MDCDDDKDALSEAGFDVDAAKAAMDKARRKVANRLKAAGAACTIGAFGVFGGLAGLLAGGSACVGALLVADDAAADLEEAVELHEQALQRHAQAFKRYLICSRRHDIAGDAVS